MSDYADAYGRTQAEERSARIRFRRALSLMLMTLVAPGSAQVVAGHRRVGLVALRVWAVVWGVVVLTVLLGALAAYAFSRFRFKGRRIGMLALLLIQMFPQMLTHRRPRFVARKVDDAAGAGTATLGQGDDEAADPHPYDQRPHQHFQGRLVFIEVAETG